MEVVAQERSGLWTVIHSQQQSINQLAEEDRGGSSREKWTVDCGL